VAATPEGACPEQRPDAGPAERTGPRGGSKRRRASERRGEGAPTRGLDPGLYLAATPIGNLRDVTLRVLDALGEADCIACEDTRVTGRLLAAYGIARPMIAYHDHNAAKVRPGLLRRLRDGQAVVLVSDAGTPLVSDPGYRLVQEALAAGVPVHPLPGPSASLAALLVSGLPSDRFLFAGFLPARAGPRRRALEELAGVEATLVFFESGPRLAAALADMAEVLGERPAAVARELTKLFEEVVRDRLGALARRYAEGAPPKGEIAVVVGPPEDAVPAPADVDALLHAALATMAVRDAAASVARATGRPRREVYQRALALRAGPGP
jgi:16S rRNA (cytidine1402-2'-O)-methyltransferase